MQYKKFLITGGGGFIGSTLIRRLLKNDDLIIYNLDKVNYACDIRELKKFTTFKNYKHFKVDLKDKANVEKTLFECSPDAVIHLAAESHVDKSIVSPELFIDSNIVGTFNLLEAIRKYWETSNKINKELFRLHHVSTDEVFGSLGESGKFNEESKIYPRSPYSASKAASDHLVSAWHHTFGIPISISNCSNNFGPFQFPDKLIPLCIEKCIKKENIPLYGDGKNIRDWLFVDDHIDALLLIMNKGEIGKKYCIGGSQERTNIEIINLICNLMDKYFPEEKPHSKLIKYVKDRPGHDKRYGIDSSLIQDSLGWRPKHSLEESLEITIKWYLEKFDKEVS